MTCNHLHAHEILPPKDKRDAFIREEMRRGGWFVAGWCEMYYPEWLYAELGERYDRAVAASGLVEELKETKMKTADLVDSLYRGQTLPWHMVIFYDDCNEARAK